MENLNFKTLLVVFILAIGILVVSPFTPDSTADSYYLYVKLTPVKCWDNSGSIDVFCYSYTEVDWWTDPLNHGNQHSTNGYYTLAGNPKNYYTIVVTQVVINSHYQVHFLEGLQILRDELGRIHS